MLDPVFRHAEAFLASVDDRPVGAAGRAGRAARRGSRARLPDEPRRRPAQVIDELVARRRSRARRERRAALLRLRDRPGAAGRARRGHARRGRGTRTRSATSPRPPRRSSRRSRSGWVLDVLGLPATRFGRASSRARRWPTRRAWRRRATTVLGAARVGRRARRADRRAAADGDRRRGGARDDLQRAALHRARRGAASSSTVDVQGAIDADALSLDGPAIVCAQAGNVNTGAFDPLERAGRRAAVRRARGCTWTARSGCGRRRRPRAATSSPAPSTPTRGPPTPTSGSTCPTTAGWRSSPTATRTARAMGLSAAYLVESEHRQNYDYTPEASRRARGFAVYAALRSLGRSGLAALVDRCCEHARALRGAAARRAAPRCSTRSSLNQVLVACAPDAIARVQADGTCWLRRDRLARAVRDAHLGLRLRHDDRGRRALRRGDSHRDHRTLTT